MATPDSTGELPNLKIEIENCVDEAMETDDGGNISDSKNSKDDAEEGEISDCKDTEAEINAHTFGTVVSLEQSVWERDKRYENNSGGFVTGLDIFDEKEQNKLGERAKRFGLDPSELKAVTEEQLDMLYTSLGVKNENGIEKHFRLNSLHMRGTENMNTQDIFSYFKDYAPASIEWINDYTCNVVWLDDLSAARAILGLSKQIRGLKPTIPKDEPTNKEEPTAKDAQEEKKTKDDDVNIVVVDQIRTEDGEIIMVVDEVHKDENEDEDTGDEMETSKTTEDIAVDSSDITVPIPPGPWRKGVDTPKAKCILLRFSTRSDKKLPQAEKLSEYYKRYGNPNYGGIKGLITTSRKRRYLRNEMNKKIFDDDQGDERDFKIDDNNEDNKNPWGNLAKSWSNIDKNRGKKRTDPYDGESPPRRMTPPPSPQMDRIPHRGKSVLKRIGIAGVPSESSHLKSEEDSGSSSDDTDWTRRSKVPRMRMYADEEQVRIQRRKAVVQAHSKREPSIRHGESVFRSQVYDKDMLSSESRERENVRREREDAKHVSRNRARSREDLRSRLGKSRKELDRSRGSIITVSSKWKGLNHQAVDSRTRSNRAAESSSGSESESDDSCIEENEESNRDYTDLRDCLVLGKKQSTGFSGEDLRSKLNLKKNLKQISARQKSPLRIEIDNDEYYRLIGSDQE